jgi:UDP-glucose 4-epimerase
MSSKRILVTGISSYWGGQLARRLESDPAVETVIGVDRDEPRVELERTEYVRVGHQHRLLRRIVDAAAIDTVVDTRLIVDSANASPRDTHENNVLGTMNILAACSGADSPVEKFVFKSSAHYYGCEQDDPSFFTEEDRRPHPARTLLEKDIVEAERAVAEFASRSTPCDVAIIRVANKIGPDLETSHTRLFDLPVVPTILGFDPRYQFIHEEDVVGVLEHAVRNELVGIYNAAADGVLVLSEILDLLGKRMAPVIPPWGTDLVAGQVLKRLGVRLTPEMLSQLRFGRGLDNRKLKATGYEYRFTTREAVIKLGEHWRTRAITHGSDAGYVYEREVEEFLRWSPSVQAGSRPAGPGAAEDRPPGAVPGSYDELGDEEVVSIVASLGRDELEELRRYEVAGPSRRTVLVAIDRHLARQD